MIVVAMRSEMFRHKDGEEGIAVAMPMQPDDVGGTSQWQGCDKNCLACSKAWRLA